MFRQVYLRATHFERSGHLGHRLLEDHVKMVDLIVLGRGLAFNAG